MFKLSIVVAISASLASAATFYVSPQGNDTNAGTQVAPWATLQHAVDRISPGDSILVAAGTYAGCRIGFSGGDQAPKTLIAVTGAQVVVNRPGPQNKHNSNIEVENFAGHVTDWVISGLEVTNSPKYGIDVRVTDRISVTQNHVHNSALTGIFTAFSDHVLIQGNETDHNGEHGIYQSNSSVYPTIRANLSHHNLDAGIHMSGDSSMNGDNSEKQNGVSTGLVQFATVENNTIYENGLGGGSAINCDGVDSSIFRNNLLYNNHASGISLYAINGRHGSSHNKIYNNTIVMAANSRYPINIPDDGEKTAPTDNTVENNILYTPDLNHGSILVSKPNAPGFHSDFNVVANRFSKNNGNNTLTLAQWQALGYDLHSIIATPAQLFANPAGNNYQLAGGSPALDSGTVLMDVLYDMLGVPRPQGSGYDIGCFETVANYILF